MVVIDYIQLISISTVNNDLDKISYISKVLKTLTLDLNIPIIVVSQLSRQIEEREDKRPTLMDLNNVASLVQDSDKIVFLYRENYYNKNYKINNTEIIVSKNRGGETGTLELTFDECTGVYN